MIKWLKLQKKAKEVVKTHKSLVENNMNLLKEVRNMQDIVEGYEEVTKGLSADLELYQNFVKKIFLKEDISEAENNLIKGMIGL